MKKILKKSTIILAIITTASLFALFHYAPDLMDKLEELKFKWDLWRLGR